MHGFRPVRPTSETARNWLEACERRGMAQRAGGDGTGWGLNARLRLYLSLQSSRCGSA